MDRSEVLSAVAELRSTSESMRAMQGSRLDLDVLEKIVARREHAVRRIRNSVEQCPECFCEDDLDAMRDALAAGKRAFENLLEIRKKGWTTATDYSRNRHI